MAPNRPKMVPVWRTFGPHGRIYFNSTKGLLWSTLGALKESKMSRYDMSVNDPCGCGQTTIRGCAIRSDKDCGATEKTAQAAVHHNTAEPNGYNIAWPNGYLLVHVSPEDESAFSERIEKWREAEARVAALEFALRGVLPVAQSLSEQAYGMTCRYEAEDVHLHGVPQLLQEAPGIIEAARATLEKAGAGAE